MISTQSRVLTRKRAWQAAAGACTLDLVGLAVCLIVASLLRPLPETHGARFFLLLLLVFGANVRILEGRVRSIETVLGKPHLQLLLVPVVTALTVILVNSLSRSFYSLGFALPFVILWTLWILVSQLSFQRLREPLRLLVIEPAPFADALTRLGGLKITTRSAPPAHFDDWDLVLLDPARQYSAEWNVWLGYADMFGIRCLSAPLAIEGLTGRLPLNMLFGEWPHEIFVPRTRYVGAKRILDTTLVILSLPVVLPLLAGLCLAVLLADGRPALFWQSRVGMGGRSFRILKIRTMRTDTEGSAANFTSPGDLRVTRLGKLLRNARLDELPQLWNVLRGEMSLIGPRPEQAEFVHQFRSEIPMFDLRHNLRPGITGWAQVMQGYAASVDDAREKLCFDLYYVRRCSPLLDLRIALKTVVTVATGFGSR